MTRALSPTDVIRLPALSSEDAYTLVSSVLHQASAVPAPATLDELVVDLRAAHAHLHAQLVARRAAPGLDTRAAVDADRRVDLAWSALRDWLSGWTKLGPAAPRETELRELHSFLFGDGLAFLALRHEAQWAACETRMAGLSAHRNDELVRSLGGAPFLEQLRDAHDAYGRALGVTESPPTPIDGRVRDAREVMLDSLREYVVAVLGTVRRSRPETQAQADQLLRPIVHWKTPRAQPASGGEPEGERPDPPAT